MRILIYTSDTQVGEFAKSTLQEFGRGMHITVSADSKKVEGHWSYIIAIGEMPTGFNTDTPSITYPLPKEEEEFNILRRRLWALYRDELRDRIGNKCSCGLFDVCHCH